MKIEFNIDYNANWEQEVFVCGSIPELGNYNEGEAVKLNCSDGRKWKAIVSISTKNVEVDKVINYFYLIKENGQVIRDEAGAYHYIEMLNKSDITVYDLWKENSDKKFLASDPFQNCFLPNNKQFAKPKFTRGSVVLQVISPILSKNQVIGLLGDSRALGNWQPKKTLLFTPVSSDTWQLFVSKSIFELPIQFKLVVYNTEKHAIDFWEHGENRNTESLGPIPSRGVTFIELPFIGPQRLWKAAGTSIPVFSLRSKDSLGVGDFLDLKKMVDWVAMTGQKFIQILPINDTTATHTWRDSYPYNAISTYALHPIYFGAKEYPLKNKGLQKELLEEGKKLNAKVALDYEKAVHLKLRYLNELYHEIGKATAKSVDYQLFVEENQDWLFPYACFCYFRDEYKTANFAEWKDDKEFSYEKCLKKIEDDKHLKEAVDKTYFIQYILSKQLKDVKKYANKHGIALKGDIAIGVNPHSVEAWSHPKNFNLSLQAGAPPDLFSAEGQNWGFPTYNWAEIEKHDYDWWTNRLQNMKNYFDAYRIDHILGFFRIWSIPDTAVQGLLGYFSPALPFSKDELAQRNLHEDIELLTVPLVHESNLTDFFDDYTDEIIETYLTKDDNNPAYYKLRPFCDNQAKIKKLFADQTEELTAKDKFLRSALYRFCNEVLFIKDQDDQTKYHPKINLQKTKRFETLSDQSKWILGEIYADFFYHRHNDLWKSEAYKKLPALIDSTDMLACGEDLGMIPASVPEVMNDLQILSLEVQRDPKSMNQNFGRLDQTPYLSVCTTSTHDMPPVRLWWEEDMSITQEYYNKVLGKEGEAPLRCSEDICYDILKLHLDGNSMLAILPLQDWFGIDESMHNPKFENEQINKPSVPRYYWRYRMHKTIEEMMKEASFNAKVKHLITESGR